MPTSTKAKEQEKEKATAEAKAKEQESKREQARREKEEAAAKAREAKIDSGDLIVTKTHEFERTTKETKSSQAVAKIVEAYRKSDKPLVFADVCSKAGAKYPEDMLPAMLALEHLGLVQRFDARSTGENGRARRPTAFLSTEELRSL